MSVRFGEVRITPGALELMTAHHAGADAYHAAATYLRRHLTGDWGVVDEHDRRANDDAAESGNRILSAYIQPCGNTATCPHGDHKLWIITDAGHRITTLLLPRDY
jgi:hypothetical protein